MGVKSGVPDIIITDRTILGHSCLTIELKVGKNKVSENQLKWAGRAGRNGWRCIVSYSLQGVKDAIKDHYNLNL